MKNKCCWDKACEKGIKTCCKVCAKRKKCEDACDDVNCYIGIDLTAHPEHRKGKAGK